MIVPLQIEMVMWHLKLNQINLGVIFLFSRVPICSFNTSAPSLFVHWCFRHFSWFAFLLTLRVCWRKIRNCSPVSVVYQSFCLLNHWVYHLLWCMVYIDPHKKLGCEMSLDPTSLTWFISHWCNFFSYVVCGFRGTSQTVHYCQSGFLLWPNRWKTGRI